MSKECSSVAIRWKSQLLPWTVRVSHQHLRNLFWDNSPSVSMVQGGFLSILSTDYIKLKIMGLKTSVRLWKFGMSEGCLPLQKTAFLTSCIFLTSVRAEPGKEMWVMELLISCACQLLFCTWALLPQDQCGGWWAGLWIWCWRGWDRETPFIPVFEVPVASCEIQVVFLFLSL